MTPEDFEKLKRDLESALLRVKKLEDLQETQKSINSRAFKVQGGLTSGTPTNNGYLRIMSNGKPYKIPTVS